MSTLQVFKQPWTEKGTTDMLALCVKLGDQETTEGTPGYRDGEIIESVDYDTWVAEAGIAPVISDKNARIFQWVVCEKSKADKVQEAIEWNSSCKDPSSENYNSNERYIIAKEDKIFDGVRDKWAVKEAVKEYVDGFGKEFNSFVKKCDLGALTPDVNAISGGTTTIGSGGVYLTVTALAADLTNLTSNLTATFVSATMLSATANPSINQNGYDIILEGAGYTISVSVAANGILVNNSGSGNFELKDIVFDCLSGHNGRTTVSFSGSDYTGVVSRCHFNGNDYGGYAVRIDTTTMPDVNATLILDYKTRGILCADSSSAVAATHCTIKNSFVNFGLSSTASIITNCYSFGAAASDYFAHENATADYAYSDDSSADNANWGTGTNCSANRTPANDFVDVGTMVPARGGGLAAGAVSTVIQSLNSVAIPNAGGTRYIGAKAQTTLVDLSGATLTPNSGPEVGGTSVSVSGAVGLGTSGGACVFGANAGTVDSHDNTSATVTTPAGLGVVDFTWSNSDGESDTIAAAFTYLAAALNAFRSKMKIGIGIGV